MINFYGGDGFDSLSLDTGFVKETFNPLWSGFRPPRALWFKGGSSSDNVDEAYNARMATIAEAQQDIAEEYYNFWEDVYKPLETVQAAADQSLITDETAQAQAEAQLGTATANSEMALLPSATEAAQAEYDATATLLPAQTDYALSAMDDSSEVRSAFYDEALSGVDVESRANKAAADAAQAFTNANSQMSRNAARTGVNPNSGNFAAMSTQNSLNQAKTISSAKTNARTAAENENFGRLTSAMSTTVTV